ncbi:AAA family ATPase [Candidatus Woesebacteria bacterium]|nr:AAA family ATPase [Candidatus Woesebacteria bacterium]
MTSERELKLNRWCNPEQLLLLKDTKIILMAGLPGSGKTTITNAIAEEFGAIVLRSDKIRQQIFEDSTALDVDSEKYLEKSEGIYEHMRDEMVRLVEKGEKVIVDATHLNHHRQAVIARLKKEGLIRSATLLLIEAKEEVIVERQKIRPGEPGTGENWEDGWKRVRGWFLEKIDEGVITYPSDNEGISIIRIENN